MPPKGNSCGLSKHSLQCLLHVLLFELVTMKNSSTTLKKGFFVVGLMIVAILVCKLANAGDGGMTFSVSAKDFLPRSNLSHNPENARGGTDLIVPLSGSLSLDLRLSSVGRGQSSPGEKEFGTPPIPILKVPGSDLRYSRLGVGLSFGF